MSYGRRRVTSYRRRCVTSYGRRRVTSDLSLSVEAGEGSLQQSFQLPLVRRLAARGRRGAAAATHVPVTSHHRPDDVIHGPEIPQLLGCYGVGGRLLGCLAVDTFSPKRP